MSAGSDWATRFEACQRRHGRFLWSLSYRMTGVAADADDVVQETWARALVARPNADVPLEPWLTRVAMNVAQDRLRERQKRGYVGPWLPSPIDTELEGVDGPAAAPASARYELLESVGVAFLLALESLTPNQRAVLVLRDVFDFSVIETMQALGLSESSVKTTLHRARAALEGYERSRVPLNQATQARAREALETLFTALTTGDVTTLTQLLREDVTSLSDGAGQYFAARKPVIGRERYVLYQRRLIELRGLPTSFSSVMLNGLPAFVFTLAPGRPREPVRSTLGVTLDREGRIATVVTTVADHKLTHVRFAAGEG